jgi:ABC-2 type transport system permease protein
MNSTLADTAPDGPRSDAAPAAKEPGAVLLTLVRREFWEHRALWLAPLCVVALLALCAAIGRIHIDVDEAPDLSSESQRVAIFSIIQLVLAAPLYIVIMFVGSYYLLDCLYAERKDRSILFWKSLPVSDGLTVLSKLLVALLLVPLGVFALGLVLSLALTGLWQVNAFLGRLPAIPGWDMAGWLQTELALLLCFLVGALWYAPCAAYLLLVSAWARRNPFLWLTLPPVAAQILERVAFGTHYVGGFIGYRLFGIWPKLFGHMHFGRGRAHLLGSALAQLDLGGALADLDLWLGLAAAAGLTFAAIRIRRYRDDT